MPAVVTKPQDDIKEAVRDTVTLRSQQADSPRTKMGRSQTTVLVISLSPMCLTHPLIAMVYLPQIRVQVGAVGLTLKTLEIWPKNQSRLASRARRVPSMKMSSTASILQV